MEYFSTFVGIPLPDDIASEFREKVGEIAKISPSLQICDLDSQHITLYCLGDQPADVLEEVKKIVERHLDLMSGVSIRINSLGTFGGKEPRVLFADVEPNPLLSRYQQALAEDLQVFRAPDDRPFSPHLTIGRIGEKNRRSFAKELTSIKEVYKDTTFDFLANTVSIYGIKNKKSPSQERLFDIEF